MYRKVSFVANTNNYLLIKHLESHLENFSLHIMISNNTQYIIENYAKSTFYMV